MSEETRQRVIAVAAELRYAPNNLARALRRRRSGVIGYVPFPLYRKLHERPLPTLHLLNHHIARAAMRAGYHLLEASAETAESRSGDGLARFLVGQQVDGVIFDRPASAEEVRHVVERGLPVVQLLSPQLGHSTATIAIDPLPGVTAALDHLVALGHRRIGFIGHRPDVPADRRALDAFEKTIARHEALDVAGVTRLGSTYSVEEGHTLARALLTVPDPPTAILAGTEGLVLGVLRALYEARLRVPDEVSVIATDDALAVHFYPPLTSITLPFEAIAERAMAMLTDLLTTADGAGTPAQLVLPTSLTIRASTQPPGGAA